MKVVRTVTFDGLSVTLAYMDEDTDVRSEGLVYQAHSITIGRDGPLDEEIAAVEAAVDDLVAAGVTQWATTVPYDVQQAQRDAYEAANSDDEDEHDEGQE